MYTTSLNESVGDPVSDAGAEQEHGDNHIAYPVCIRRDGNYMPVQADFSAADVSEAARPLPDRVLRCADALLRYGVGFTLSWNEEAAGCTDAAAKRWRDGQVGIPREDEMQSLVFKRRKPDANGLEYLAVHSRSADKLDLEGWLKGPLGKKSSMLKPEELAEQFNGASFGCVNPVLLSESAEELGYAFWNIWDTRILAGEGTVMTNAGDPNFGIEFEPRDMFCKLPGFHAAVRVRKVD